MQENLQLSVNEKEMLTEIFKIFSKYNGLTRKFGVQLIHSHFPLNNGETLYETHDSNKRVLYTRPVELSQFNYHPLATAWQQTKNGNIEVSMFCCDDDDGGSYGGKD